MKREVLVTAPGFSDNVYLRNILFENLFHFGRDSPVSDCVSFIKIYFDSDAWGHAAGN